MLDVLIMLVLSSTVLRKLQASIEIPLVLKESGNESFGIQQSANAISDEANWGIIREALSIYSYPNKISIPQIAVPEKSQYPVCKSVYVEHVFYIADMLGELNSTIEESACQSACNLHPACFSINFLPDQKRCFLLGSGLTLSDIDTLNIHDSVLNANLSSRHYLFGQCYDDKGRNVAKVPNAPTFESPAFASRGQCGLPSYEPLITESTKSRIVGGSTATPYTWPWVISLKTDLHHFCGGSIIRPSETVEESDIVLTAAHCVTDSNGQLRIFKNLVAVLGAHSQSTTGLGTVSATVDRVVVHPEYNPNSVINDIAILMLRRPVKFSRSISPVCLADAVPPLNGVCVDVGWGNVIELLRDGGMPDLLQQLKVPVPVDSICSKSEVWGTTFQSKYHICSGSSNGNVCSGDSGGPLLCKSSGKWTQYGVASFVAQNGCKTPNKPGVFARVSTYRNWIFQMAFNLTKVGKKRKNLTIYGWNANFKFSSFISATG